jgi:predicted metal-dependent phosphoesterase TrpH
MRRSPFTLMCQQAARLARPVVADLHAHTTASDGDHTPSQLVAAAWADGLSAVAVTDHDTTAGLAEAVATARQFTGRRIEVIAGVEVTTERAGRGFHLLGLFIDPDHPPLAARLAAVRKGRQERFAALVERVAGDGVRLDPAAVERLLATTDTVGRRHLATLLLDGGHVRSRNEAFRRLIGPASAAEPPRDRVPLAEAARLIADAGGVASLAHPPEDLTRDDLAAFAADGVTGVEAAFPAAPVSRRAELRRWAGELGLAVTGGGDSHGPDGRLGSVGLGADDFDRLRRFARPSAGQRL